MYQILAAFVTLLAAVSAVTDVEWIVFKAKHTKVYDMEQDYFRRMIYEENLKKIQEHNVLFAKGVKTFFMKENEFADKTHAEFVKAVNGYKPPVNRKKSFRRFNNMTSLPDSVDWVKAGYVAEVKNQGECGSCWSFSATGAMEGANKKATGNLVSLSEQNLIDCSWDYGNQGCEGGVVDYAFKYVIENGGVDTEASYPYKESDYGDCHYNSANVGAKMSSFEDVEQDSEAALKEATANVGPVSVAIDASHESLQLYGGGVYDEAACTINVDHAVLVVGYGSLDGKDFWMVKNSWGKSWGLHGYVMMSRNKNNQCGIASQACYPKA